MPSNERTSAAAAGGWLLNFLLVAWIALGSAYLALRYYAWPRVDDWRERIVERVSEATGHPVTIRRIETGFEGLLPRITIEGVHVAGDDGGELLDVARVVAVISPRALLDRELRFAVLQADSPRVRVERLEGGRALRVAGIDVPLEGGGDGLARFLLSQRRLIARDATIDWIDAERGVQETLAGIDVRIGNVGRRHRAALAVGRVGGAWQRAFASVEFTRPPHSGLTDWRRWHGEAFVGVDALDWGELARELPWRLEARLAAASGDARAWVDFDEGRLQDVLARVAATGVAVQGLLRDLKLAKLDFEAQARREGDGYDVRVNRLAGAEQGGFSLAAAGEQRVTLDASGRPTGGRFATGAFDVAKGIEIARRVVIDENASGLLESIRASGKVESLAASWRAGPSPAWEVNVDFNGLSMRRVAQADSKLPWFENLDGEARIGSADGEIRVRAKNAKVAFPGIFAESAIPLDKLDANARWRVDRTGERPVVAVEIADLTFANADVAGAASGTYRTGGKGAGIVDITATLSRAQASQAVRYLPLKISQEVRDWIAGAVTAGVLSDGRLRLRGDLGDFPFRREAEGEFSVTAQLADGRLNYAPGWPVIDRLQGQLKFERAGMLISMRTGRVFDVALGATQARLRDFADPLLRIEGSGEGPARDMVKFVNESPVATRIDDFTRDTVVHGDARLQLRLDLPLGDLDHAQVAGAVQFRRNDITIDRTFPPLSAVSGALEFSEQGLTLRGIEARFLGGPLRVDGETPEPGHLLIRGSGSIDADGMRSVSENALTRKLSGATQYRVTVDVQRRAASVAIDSDLQGLGSSLPAPFDKPADARWPLRVLTSALAPPNPDARSPGDTIRLELRDDLHVLLERSRDPATQKLGIRRGALAVRAKPVLPEKGLAVLLDTDRVDVDQWMPLLAGRDAVAAPPGAAPPGAAPGAAPAEAAGELAEGFSFSPDAVEAVAKVVRVGGKDLHEVRIDARRDRDLWSANIASREISGLFSWRDAAPGQQIGTLTARFSRLEIPRSRATEVESLLDSPPESLPALDVRADELILGERSLGALSLKATNGGAASAPTWTVDELKIENPSATLSARGRWDPRGQAPGFGLDFGLQLHDAGALLARFGMKDTVRGGVGKLAGDLRWSGSPLAIDYPSLSGKFSVEVGKGQFLKTDPGIAKLIGVLSLQSLPRRLTLDFSDVFAQGFAFDRIEGDVAIDKGVARTDRLEMSGVQAKVRISGTASIADETQDLVVIVRPDINAGLAAVAYGAMWHPAVGLGTLLAQYMLSAPIEQLFTYEFEVKGSWADPQVIDRRKTARAPGTATPTAPQ